LQAAAVLGREPSHRCLEKVWDGAGDLAAYLSKLQQLEFLYERRETEGLVYVFTHALTQEVAYNSLLSERRKTLHERAARAIEALYHSRLEDHYNELARHYSHSGNLLKAVEYLRLAGQQAVQRSANAEAIPHLTTALELLEALPDTPDRLRQELFLQIALGQALFVTKGQAAPEVGKAYARARELCQQVGETPQLLAVLNGLRFFYLARAEVQTARELAEQLLHLAQNMRDLPLLIDAYRGLGATLHWSGEFAPARERLERGIALYDPQQQSAVAFVHGGVSRGGCLCIVAWVLWFLGYPHQALQKSREALSLAQGLSQPFILAFALNGAAMLHQLRREGSAAQERAEAAITLCSEQGFGQQLETAIALRSWALAEQGQMEEGITQLRQGLAARRAMEAEVVLPYRLTLLAEAYGKVGQIEEGLTTLAEALAQVDKTGLRFYEAELYRLKGELLLAQARQRATGNRQWGRVIDS
jgi:predicted ATPase